MSLLSALLPILLAIAPILAVFQHNQQDVSTSALWMPLAVSAATGVVLFGICWLVTKRPVKAGVLSSLLVFGAFYYGTFVDIISGWGLGQAAFLVLWIVLVAFGVAAVARTREPITAGRILLVMAVVLALMPAVRVVAYARHDSGASTTDPRLWATSFEAPVLTKGTERPDIYLLMPDDYPRADVLKQRFGFDNSPFVNALKKRGFGIATESRSPYSDSESNMSAAVNADYLSHLPDVLGPKSENGVIVKALIDDSRASRFLKALGYTYSHFDSDGTTFPGDNPLVSRFAALDNLTYLWLRATILRPIWFNENASNARYRGSVASTFKRLNAMPSKPGPKFVVFHVMPPHDPYVFGSHGEKVQMPNASDETNHSRTGMKYFVNQLRSVNTKLLESVDTIVNHSKTPPIIIIQADEGFETNEDIFGPDAAEDIRAKGFSAYYLQGTKVADLPQDLNTVNTFRFLFDRYFGTRFKMLPNHSYTEGDRAYQWDEIQLK